MWWQTALVAPGHIERLTPVFFRIHITQMTGHRATPDSVESAALGEKGPLGKPPGL
jgi:hypothetical protein